MPAQQLEDGGGPYDFLTATGLRPSESVRAPSPSTRTLSERAWPSPTPILDRDPGPRPRAFDSLAVVPSNVRAIETGILFAGGLVTDAAIVGPSGWGKSHLTEAVANRIGVDRGPRCCELWNTVEWLNLPSARNTGAALILDNVQDVLERTKCRQTLRMALERRVRAGWPTLLAFTGEGMTRQIRSLLPNFRSWSVATLRCPDAEEREVIIGQVAHAEGVLISPELRRILALRLDGNGRTLVGALKRLRLNGSKWIDAFDLLWACGILNPFFSTRSMWDLRDHILEVAQEIHAPGLGSRELATYAMLRIAQLSEADVARYLDLEPGRAYGIAQRVESVRSQRLDADRCIEAYVERIVAMLLKS